MSQLSANFHCPPEWSRPRRLRPVFTQLNQHPIVLDVEFHNHRRNNAGQSLDYYMYKNVVFFLLFFFRLNILVQFSINYFNVVQQGFTCILMFILNLLGDKLKCCHG